VDKSISDTTHNAAFQERSAHAIYVKMRVTAEELPTTLPLLKQLGFQGLSVTMPLKEAVLPLLESIDAEARAIGAVNTLLATETGWRGFNTDGKGALTAME